MPRSSSRETIIDAAEEIVLESGAGHLTLDAAAERAGVSKGGLLYHFPSKHALLAAMMERLRDSYDRRRAAVIESLPESPARELKAHVLTALSPDDQEERARQRRVASAILATIANDPTFKDSIKCDCGSIIRRIATTDGEIDPCKIVFLLAVDGLKFWELIGMSPLDEAERQRVFESLLELADRAAAGKLAAEAAE